MSEASRTPKEGQGATTRCPGGHLARLGAWPRQGGAWTPGGPPGCPPSPIYSPPWETSEDRTLFRNLASVPSPLRFQDREHRQDPSWHPAGGRIDLRELLHHGCFPDVP